MAKKSNNGSKNKGSKSAALPAVTEIDRIIDAALADAAALGWRNLSMTAVAARAGLTLGDVLMRVPTRAHLVARIYDRLDARMLAGVKAVDEADSVRDRLFDVVMKRFDAMNSNREGMRAVVAGLRFDPPAAAFALCRTDRSAAAMLAAAGVSPDGLLGYARVQGMKVVLVCALRAWVNDDSQDLAKTMAALDRALERAERLAGFKGFRRPSEEAAA
jgi:ubiquinone biosynthesis protein COQ9